MKKLGGVISTWPLVELCHATAESHVIDFQRVLYTRTSNPTTRLPPLLLLLLSPHTHMGSDRFCRVSVAKTSVERRVLLPQRSVASAGLFARDSVRDAHSEGSKATQLMDSADRRYISITDQPFVSWRRRRASAMARVRLGSRSPGIASAVRTSRDGSGARIVAAREADVNQQQDHSVISREAVGRATCRGGGLREMHQRCLPSPPPTPVRKLRCQAGWLLSTSWQRLV